MNVLFDKETVGVFDGCEKGVRGGGGGEPKDSDYSLTIVNGTIANV